MDYSTVRWILTLTESDTEQLTPQDVVGVLGNDTIYLALFTSRERASEYAPKMGNARPRRLSDKEVIQALEWHRNMQETHIAIDPTRESMNLIPMQSAFIHIEMSIG